MKINAIKMGVAAALAFAILWPVCSLLVWGFPAFMMNMSGHMVHADLTAMAWHMSIAGMLAGLVSWTVVAGITAWITASIYNRVS